MRRPTIMNVYEINVAARAMGDLSSLAKGEAVQRLVNRGVGRGAGKAFGFANAHFGVWGMVATAQFFATLKNIIKLQTAEAEGPINIGSAVRYASLYHNGSPNAPARPFLLNALLNTPVEESRGSKYFRMPTSFRGGIYQGQKYLGDFGAFYRGDIGRFARRAAGREIAGFFWGSLRLGAETRRPNFLESYARRVCVQARKNIRAMGQDTGTLAASIAYGFGDAEMTQKSKEAAALHMGRKGILREAKYRLVSGVVPTGAGNIANGITIQ